MQKRCIPSLVDKFLLSVSFIYRYGADCKSAPAEIRQLFCDKLVDNVVDS
jgi:hypothetical protein